MNKLYAIRVALERTLEGKSIIIRIWVIDCNTKTYPIDTANNAYYDAQICSIALSNYSILPRLNSIQQRIVLNDEPIKKYIQKKPNDFAQKLQAINEYEGAFFLTKNPSTFYNVLRNIPMVLLDKIQINSSSINAYQHKFLIKIRELLSN